jgi:hypothetical protein
MCGGTACQVSSTRLNQSQIRVTANSSSILKKDNLFILYHFWYKYDGEPCRGMIRSRVRMLVRVAGKKQGVNFPLVAFFRWPLCLCVTLNNFLIGLSLRDVTPHRQSVAYHNLLL